MREVHPENVWVGLRTPNRGRDRPDQTPGSADKGGRTPGQHDFLFHIKNLLNLFKNLIYYIVRAVKKKKH